MIKRISVIIISAIAAIYISFIWYNVAIDFVKSLEELASYD